MSGMWFKLTTNLGKKKKNIFTVIKATTTPVQPPILVLKSPKKMSRFAFFISNDGNLSNYINTLMKCVFCKTIYNTIQNNLIGLNLVAIATKILMFWHFEICENRLCSDPFSQANKGMIQIYTWLNCVETNFVFCSSRPEMTPRHKDFYFFSS